MCLILSVAWPFISLCKEQKLWFGSPCHSVLHMQRLFSTDLH